MAFSETQDAQDNTEQHNDQQPTLTMPGLAAAAENGASRDEMAAATDGAAPPADGIRAFDQQGREIIVPREEWRAHVLPNLLREVWDAPDQLYVVLVNSFNDGFFAEVAEAAEHLFGTDPQPARGTAMWAIVLTETGRLDEAKAVLEGFLAGHAADASVLFHLAKVQSAQGEPEAAQATLERALEVDPNHDNALAWHASQEQQRGGDRGVHQALTRVAGMRGSWRAQVWMARAALMGNDLQAARALYLNALERAPRPVPPELLMQMSGDLGGHGHLAELIDLTQPYYLPETHGLPVGNNLIKANVDLGRLGSAEQLTARLAQMNQQMNRPDWTQALGYWAGEIARRRGAVAGSQQQQQGIQLGLLRIDGPVWLPEHSPARGVFGAKPAGGLVVSFLGGTAEAPEEGSDGDTPDRLDLVARMTRAVPLFLSEQTELETGAQGRATLPWAVGQGNGVGAGFVVSSAAWADAMAVQMVGNPSNQADYVVSTHLDAEVEPWTAMLAFVRTADGTRIGEIEREFSPDAPEEGLRQLAAEVVELLGAAAGRADREAVYEVPRGEQFMSYLLRLEQLLAVRCAAMDGAPKINSGERGVLEQVYRLAAAEPGNVPARLLLLETRAAVERLQPESAAEYAEPVRQLSEEHPLPMLDRVFAGSL